MDEADGLARYQVPEVLSGALEAAAAAPASASTAEDSGGRVVTTLVLDGERACEVRLVPVSYTHLTLPTKA